MFPEDISIGEDLLFNLRYLTKVHCAAMVNRPLYEYNITNSSATRKQNRNLWAHYKKLSGCVAELLEEIFLPEAELTYNIERQYLIFAINIAEEQLVVFFQGKQLLRELKALCGDARLKQASSYVIKHGRNRREQLQAFFFRYGMVRTIRLWLTKK